MNHEPISQAGLPLPLQMGGGGGCPSSLRTASSSPESLPLRTAEKTLIPQKHVICKAQGTGCSQMGHPPAPTTSQAGSACMRKDLVHDPLAWPFPPFLHLPGTEG